LDYKKYYTLPVAPELVYAALTNEATIELWTGAKATMIPESETEFSLWDGSIVGKNISFEIGKKIVQQWYFGEQEEASMVTMKLHEHKKGCSVELHHTNIPDADFEEMKTGWDELYFGSLEDFYSED
jgi:activator of HSP90 ATPase